MPTQNRNGKERLVDAAVRLVTRDGAVRTSVRAIARAAGVTEAALYRHFRSKDELYLRIYTDQIVALIAEKERIAAERGPFRKKLRAWIAASYAAYDRNPGAFTFVWLTPRRPPRAAAALMTRQGRLLMDLARAAQRAGEMRPLPAKLVLSHFTGLMLNVPRLMNDGVLPRPARRYVDDVAAAVWRVFEPEGCAGRETPALGATWARGRRPARRAAHRDST